ncbi:MAG TPA: MATE family efflux transporter, partial [Gemmatimonadaceae bacterium]
MTDTHPPKASGTSELRATVSLAIPVVAVQFGFMAMGAVDTLMVGRISATMLAAVALGNLYFFNVSIFSAGTLMALDPLVAQAIGAKDSGAVSRAVQHGLVLAVGLSLVTALLLAPAVPFLRALHQPPEIVPDAAAYLHISIVGVLPFLAFVVLRQSLQAMHRVAPIVWTVVIANGTNAALNWVFVYGHLGSPALGVEGSAIATAISRWTMMILLLVFAWRELKPNIVPFHRDALEWPALRRMLAVGLPIGSQQLLEAAAFGAIGLLMGVLGTIEMAAHQIAITLAALTFMVPLGVGSAAAVRVGHAIGAGDGARAQEAIRAAYLCGVGFMMLTAVGFLTAPKLLASAFSSDARVITLAAMLIPIAGVFQIFDGGQAVGAGVLRGAGDTTAPLIVMLGAYWLVGVPVSAYLGFKTTLRAAGLWWGFVISLGTVAVLLYLRIRIVFARGVQRLAVDDSLR